jgi:hypothetical protein
MASLTVPVTFTPRYLNARTYRFNTGWAAPIVTSRMRRKRPASTAKNCCSGDEGCGSLESPASALPIILILGALLWQNLIVLCLPSLQRQLLPRLLQSLRPQQRLPQLLQSLRLHPLLSQLAAREEGSVAKKGNADTGTPTINHFVVAIWFAQ